MKTLAIIPAVGSDRVILSVDNTPAAYFDSYTDALEHAIVMVNNEPAEEVMSSAMDIAAQTLYLDYFNNFASVERFAEVYSLDEDTARQVIFVGKRAHERIIEENTVNESTEEVPPPKMDEDDTTVRIRFSDGDGKSLLVMLCESELTGEWSKYAADSSDWFGSAMLELGSLCDYTAHRFGSEHRIISSSGCTPPASGFEKPDPNEWYMWEAVNAASEKELSVYAEDLNAIIAAATTLGKDY